MKNTSCNTYRDERPIAVYNPENQSLIGIFCSQGLLAKYLFGTNKTYAKAATLSRSLSRKHKVRGSDLGVPIAIRFANKEQETLLGGEKVLMLDDSLKKLDPNILKDNPLNYKIKN